MPCQQAQPRKKGGTFHTQVWSLQQKLSHLLYFTHRSYSISFNRTTAPAHLQGVQIPALSHLSLFPCRLALQRAGRSPPPSSPLSPPPSCITAGPSHSRSPGITASLPKPQPRCPAGAGALSSLLFHLRTLMSRWGTAKEGPAHGQRGWRRREAERIPDLEIHCPLVRGSQMHGTSSTTHR